VHSDGHNPELFSQNPFCSFGTDWVSFLLLHSLFIHPELKQLEDNAVVSGVSL